MERLSPSNESQDTGLKARFKRAAAAFIRFATKPQAEREAAELRQQLAREAASEREERNRLANAKTLPAHLRVGPDDWMYDKPRPVSPAAPREAAKPPVTLPGRLAQVDGVDTLRSPAAKELPVALPGRTVKPEDLPAGTPPWAIVKAGWREGDQEPRPGTVDQEHPAVAANHKPSATIPGTTMVDGVPTFLGVRAQQSELGWPEGVQGDYNRNVIDQGYPLPPSEKNPNDPMQ